MMVLAAEGALNSTGVATGGASRLTSAVFKLGAFATQKAAQAASPSAKLGAARLSIFTTGVMEKMSKKDQALTDEERKEKYAAMKIQKNWRRLYYCEPMLKQDGSGIFIHGYHKQRAARFVAKAMGDYKTMINREKWMMIMRMERKDIKQREQRKKRAATKDENKNLSVLKKQRHVAEHAAKTSGWGVAGKDKTLGMNVKWTKKEEAILVGAYLKFGFPKVEPDWQQFYHFFAGKERRQIRSKMASMKDDESLFDMKKIGPENIDPRELFSLGLNPDSKEKVKKKVLTLADML
jgi:hypothetical protein